MDSDKGGYRQINKSLNICAFDDYLKGQTARLPKLAHVEQLTPRVLRVLGQNPGKVSGSCDNVGSLRVRDLTGRCSSRSKAPTHTSLEAAANA
jgi:hypothetical protein